MSILFINQWDITLNIFQDLIKLYELCTHFNKISEAQNTGHGQIWLPTFRMAAYIDFNVNQFLIGIHKDRNA